MKIVQRMIVYGVGEDNINNILYRQIFKFLFLVENMSNKENLVNYLKKVKKIGKEEYQKIAELFEKVVVEDISEIWEKHKGQIDMKLNNIPVCLKGSAVNSSTAFGFLIEEFLVQQLPKNEYFVSGDSTVNSVYDVKLKDDEKIELLVNLKVEKEGVSNNGVCAGNILKNYYDRDDKPKLYLILKSKYKIDEKCSKILFSGIKSLYLESFLTKEGMLRSDSRNWSNVFNILSGRIQLPNKNNLKNIGIKDIPEPQKILRFMDILGDKLLETKKIK